MKKKNTQANEVTNAPVKPVAAPGLKTDILRTELAIGVLSLGISVLALYLINAAIYGSYHPNIKAVLDKVTPLSFLPVDWFAPEPVERLQYQLSLLATPFLALFSFMAVNKARDFFMKNPVPAMVVNVAGILTFIVFIVKLMGQKLLYVPEAESTAFYFSKNLSGQFSGVLVGILSFYLLAAYLFVAYYKKEETSLRKTIVKVVCYALVGLVALDVFLYDLLNIAFMQEDMLGEINPVFYSITQVYAGKALLVDFNAQYGLYGWVLYPVFKLIGLSTYNFSAVMGFLNAASFVLMYLAIRKIIKRDILSLMVFLCLIFWQFWQTRLPFVTETHAYYQYWPLRTLFPCIAFYLLALYNEGNAKRNKILLPLLSFSAAIGVLWNIDTGLVVFGAVLVALLFSAYHELPLKDAIKKGMVYLGWMAGALVTMILLFFVSTKIHTGVWPNFGQAAQYQSIFYISGFFMLAMSPLHFWNVPALVYVATCIYIVLHMRKAANKELPVIVYLFILGAGLFSYFQGRSYDLTVNAVMYPAIIMIGVFCDRLYTQIQERDTWIHEGTIAFLVLFLFLADGAFSMIYNIPTIHEIAMDNARAEDPLKEDAVKERMAFISNNIPAKDTVLILSRNFESYDYALGGYVNPMNIAGSTEFFFKADLDTIVNYIKTDKYPIIFDGLRPLPPWYLKDSLIHQLSLYTEVVKATKDRTLLLLKPTGKKATRRLVRDAATVYYNDLGEFNRFVTTFSRGSFSANFDIECIVSLDTTRLTKDNLLFTNASDKIPYCGLMIQQAGDDKLQYRFMYGTGSAWTCQVLFKLSAAQDNHLLVSMRNGTVTVYNNDQPVGQATGNGPIKNSDGNFYIDNNFPGVVKEVKIENH